MRGPETEQSHQDRLNSGFYDNYMQGYGLDIGYQGSLKDKAEPVLSTATGVDLTYPGYDGITLPFSTDSQDYVFASHVLEHISLPTTAIKEWYRVTKTNGYIIICVPHQYLYEKKGLLPSKWNRDHKRFYTPSVLLAEIEYSLPANHYRIRYLRDNDTRFDYDLGPDKHSGGCYEIECVIQKINPPTWKLE